jgi:hypothetical protein
MVARVQFIYGCSFFDSKPFDMLMAGWTDSSMTVSEDGLEKAASKQVGESSIHVRIGCGNLIMPGNGLKYTNSEAHGL